MRVITPLAAHTAACVLCFTVLQGCDGPAITVYEAPRDAPREVPPVPQATGGQPEASPATPPALDEKPPPWEEADLRWVLPEGWAESDETPPMRFKTFIAQTSAGEVEIALSRFPGDVGGVLANINRWRMQVGLAEIGPEALESEIERFSTHGLQGYAAHLTGEAAHMLAAGIAQPSAGRTWFIRATTTPDKAHEIKDRFMAFARSFHEPSSPAPEHP